MCMALSDDVFELLLSFSNFVCLVYAQRYFHLIFVFPMSVIGVVTDRDDDDDNDDDTPVLHHVRRSRAKRVEKWEREMGEGKIRVKKKRRSTKNIQRFSKQIYVLRHAFNCFKCTFHRYTYGVCTSSTYMYIQ